MPPPFPLGLTRAQFVAGLLLFRFGCSLLIRYSFFNPDEYWQSLEVAHKIVFGYGHVTWEWTAGLRSYIHPLLFTPPWLLLKALHIDTTTTLDISARLVQVRRESCPKK